MTQGALVQNRPFEPVPEGISTAQGIALASLLAGKTHTSAARDAGVSRSTLYRWIDDPNFLAYLNSCRAERMACVRENLQLLSGQAVATLKRLMSRKSVPDAVKLQAARTVLELASDAEPGPTDVEDARNAILKRKKKREMETRMAELGVSREDLIRHLDRPIEEYEVDDELDDLDDDLDLEAEDDLDADEDDAQS